jgi:hypothetical protein
MSAALVLSFSGLLLWACAASWRSRAASRWPIAPAHHCTASDTVKDSSVIIACNAAPALLGGGDGGGISFSKRSQHLDGQLLQAPVTLGRFTTTVDTPRMLPASLPASMSACPYLLPSSTETRIPYGFSGWPSGHLLRCSLNGVLPQTQGIPCFTGLNPRALDPQTSAACPRTSEDVQFP